MVREETERLCRDAMDSFRDSEPCQHCRKKAEATIPPVASHKDDALSYAIAPGGATSASNTAPALVSAEEYEHENNFRSTFGERILATLQHYEAEVGRLAEEADIAAKQHETQQGLLVIAARDRDQARATLAREAPFAALGRYEASDSVDGEEYGRLVRAARAALAEEAKAKEPEVAPSGWTYERSTAAAVRITCKGQYIGSAAVNSEAIPPIDREFVAALMGGGK